MPSYSGIRPKIVPPAVARQDFLMQGPREHGVAGLINLFGIELPGLTSSLAIADHVAGHRPSRAYGAKRTSATKSPRADERQAHPRRGTGLAIRLTEDARLVDRCRRAVCLNRSIWSLTINFRRFNSTICRSSVERCSERFVQFAFEKLVFAFQFNEMGLYCHSHSSSVETSDSIRTSKSTPDWESVDGNRKIAALIFSGICNQS